MNWRQLLCAERDGRNTSSEQSRSAFEQDYDRIIFSHPFRRLQDKTQVHPLPEHDFVHTRLTHSLEVSSVGRSLGRKAGEAILKNHPDLASTFSPFDFGAIVAAASLAHDLGNPPFGHAGEDSISDFFSQHEAGLSFKKNVSEEEWADLITFEGNAQGFRLINSNQYGLKLTMATLGAFTKYPCQSLFPQRDKSKKSQKKFGYFQSEKEIFKNVAGQLGLKKTSEHSWCRHPLTFLVEAADDICYSIIDLEDGCRLGLVSFDETVALLAKILQEDFKPEKLQKINGQNARIGTLRALAIRKLVDDCTRVFLKNENDILNGTFDKALADECDFKHTLSEISKLSVERIYRARHVVEIEASGHEILPGLLHEFTMAGRCLMGDVRIKKYQNMVLLLPEEVRIDITKEPGNYYNMLRQVTDFVSGLTDRYALFLFRKIKGMSW